MKCIRTALTIAAVSGLIAGYVARDISEYLTSPFSGNKHEVTYSSRSPNFTSTLRVKLDKQPDLRTTTFLNAIHGGQNELLALISDRTLNSDQMSKICVSFNLYQYLLSNLILETEAPEDQIREKPKKRQERLPNDSFKAYPVFARR